MSLLTAHPVLATLREVRTPWDLRAAAAAIPLSPAAVDAGLLAWIDLDRVWGDEAGATAHDAMRSALSRALAIGVDAWFAERAAACRDALPGELRPLLADVHAGVLAFLRRDAENELTDAAEAMDRLLRSQALAAAPPAIQLLAFSEATALFDGLLQRTQDDEMLRRVIACCDATIAAWRDLDVHPLGSVLNLDARLAATAALVSRRLGVRYARNGDAADSERAVAMAKSALQLTSPSAPDFPLRLGGVAVALGFDPDEEKLRAANEHLAAAVELEPPTTAAARRFREQLGSGLMALHERTGDAATLDEAVRLLSESMTSEVPDAPGR